MLIYEVSLQIDQSLADAFEAWLTKHIGAMMRLGVFDRAVLFHIDSNEPGGHWTVHYHAQSREKLNMYFHEHAARMQAEAKPFEGKFKADRRVLERKVVMEQQV